MSIDLESTKKNKKETDPQELRYRRRKDAIKNFAIIFLVVMLVLTFFSNTIMNYSLPQVAVQYMESGSITTTIRGTGTVESGDPYNVIVKETRTVSSITARVGQEVRQGDILFSLSSEDSEELEAAKEELKNAQEVYDDRLLKIDITSSIIASSQGTISTSEYRSKITVAQNEMDAAQKEYDSALAELDKITQQMDALGTLGISTADQVKLDAAKDTMDDAETALINAGLSETIVYSEFTTLENAAATAKTNEDAAKSALDSANATLTSKQGIVDIAQANLDDLIAAGAQAGEIDYDNASAELAAAIAERDSAANAIVDPTTGYQKQYDDAVASRTAADTAVTNYKNGNSYKLYSAYVQAKNNYYNLKASLNNGASSEADTWNSLNTQKIAAEDKVKKAKEKLDEKTDYLGELVGDIELIRELNKDYQKIVDAQKKVDKLTTSSAAMDITAPINGTILNVYIISGKQTAAGEAAVVIQPEGQGYTMSFSVSNNEAKTISIGAAASVANSWWYNDVTGTVESIRPDTASPNTNKLVTLNLSGSLVVGQTLTMSIDSRTSNYDSIVPNSAIHEDNNGKFILVVQSKPSPLGNRYFAVRYDVQVLASDDTKSAVKAGLEGYEYVITTSSKPISAGDQVRLSEN